MTSQQAAPWHYRPDQMVVATELPPDGADQAQAHTLVRESLEQQLAGRIGGVFHPTQQQLEPLVFTAPDRPPLGFLFFDLAQQDPQFAKQVISATHANGLEAMAPVRQHGIQPVGVMPHWLASAQQDYSDGSPASYPRPTRPPDDGRWRYRYTAGDQGLNLRQQLMRISASDHVPVLILDTYPDWTRVQQQADAFAPINAQLKELVDWLGTSVELPPWHVSALQTYNTAQPHPLGLAKGPDKQKGDQDISDHALFVAGLIHDLSPLAQLHIRPVLNNFGVGDLHLLLRVLRDVIGSKRPEDPLVVNMSLGFAPKLEHLPWLWHGVRKPNDDDFVEDVPIAGETHDVVSLARRVRDVEETTRLLHVGMDRLYEYLLANNCLGVAAAGNDSLNRVEAGKPRLGPRIPARYHSVLGVAATLRQPTRAADYSNVGDEYGFGDHVATFGGDVEPDGEPDDGVVGVYSMPNFPGQSGQNLQNGSGWAMWSGTSFATAITSGLAAGYWTNRRAGGADVTAQDVLFSFNDEARNYVPALRTRSISIQGDWQHA